MNLGLDGRIALIAGASQGIGAATARVLADEGARLALVARRQEPLAAIAAEINGAGGTAFAIPADLTRQDDPQRAVDAALERFGRIDIAVVSAGAAQGGVFWEIEDRVWNEAMSLKFMGMVRLLKAVVPAMRVQGFGRIVVVVGNAGKQPGARFLPGAAANAACLAVVKGLAEEVARDGIVVNALNPGPTRTGRWTTLIENMARSTGRPAAEIEAERLAETPMGRIGEAEEMARLVAVLASDLAGMVSGTSLTADGGATKAIA